MELPKNITQIGEVGKDCKIYIEDYVISYMKQLNQSAQDKDVAVALYGKRKEENGIAYHFLYGACKLNFLQREVRHLSQAQRQEIETLRRKYFPEQDFLGYRILNGEMIEGLHLCEQEICRYIGGYARFYEKNDTMLAYMLDVRDKVEPEQVDQAKYEEVKKRQEERRSVAGHSPRNSVAARERTGEEQSTVPEIAGNIPVSANLQKMRLAAVGAFAMLCLLGIGTFREDELTGSQVGSEDVVAASGNVEQSVEQQDTLMMEDKLEQALLEENQATAELESVTEAEETSETVEFTEPSSELGQAAGTEITSHEETSSEEKAMTFDVEEQMSQPETESVEQSETTSASQSTVEAVAYVVQPGDTLISICLRQYGSDVRVADVSSLNEIEDPDDIKEGQVIMLPQ